MTMQVEFEKRADGDTIMRCMRADGTDTWQRHAGARGVFFAYHDLTHLAVERTLRRTDGIFGLIAKGWDVTETEGSSARGPLPPGAIEIENLVGLFDRERAGGVDWTAEEFNDAALIYADTHGHASPTPLTTEMLEAIRTDITALHDAWRATPAGNTLRALFHV